MNAITDRLETGSRTNEEDTSPAKLGKTGNKLVNGMVQRLTSLESGEKKLVKEMNLVQAEFDPTSEKLKRGVVSTLLSMLRVE